MHAIIQSLKTYVVNPFDHPVWGSVGSIFITIFTFLYGNGQVVAIGMSFYLLIIAADWISGYRASRKDGSYASEYGIEGAYRTSLLLLFPAIANFADQLLNMPNVIFGFVVFSFSAHIWRSMTANVYRAGYDSWIPIWVLEKIADEIEHKSARARKRIEEKEKYLEREDSRD